MLSNIVTYRGTVYPWHCDHVGHMNVMWLVGKFDEATWQLFNQLGLTPSFLRKAERGMAAVEQQISYLRELHAGDVITVHSTIIELASKRIRFEHRMRNDETGESVAITILTAVHLDTGTRKSSPFPAFVAERAAAVLPQETPNV